MPSHERVTPELLAVQQLVAVPAVLTAMRSTGILDRLDSGPATSTDLAADLDLDPDGLDRLCRVLERLGVICRTGGRWASTVPFDLIAESEGVWSSLESVLAGGPRRLRSDEAGSAAAVYPVIALRLRDVYGAAPARLADALPPIDGRILDLGAGSASWSSAMLHAWPDATATMLDLPGVADVTEQAVAEIGVADRATIVRGDLWEVEPCGSFDIVVLAAVCHLFDDARVTALLGRAVRWLAAGGRLVVVDSAGRFEPTSVDGAFHDLSLWLRSGGGHRSEATHLRWLVDAGLTGATPIDLEDGRLVAVTATLEDSR